MPTADNQPAIRSRSSSSLSQTLPSPPFTKFTQEPRSTSRHTKRLTLNFPILLPHGPNNTRRTASPTGSTVADPAIPSPDLKPAEPSPVDPSGFLTSLAAQERKVLELKEELHRAETELTILKRQWAQYEAHKKRNEINHVEKMQPLYNSTRDDMRSSIPEPEAKPSAKTGARRTQQRVFSSSKHTRTLSLLSPTSAHDSGAHSVDEALSPSSTHSGQKLDISSARVTEVPPRELKTATNTSGMNGPTSRQSMPPPSRDAFVRTSKQMASDLKDGLWTFLEDIRQATVGEEGVNATQSRTTLPTKRGPTISAASNDKVKHHNSPPAMEEHQTKTPQVTNSSVVKRSGTSFWREFGVETPGRNGRNSDQSAVPATTSKSVAQSLLDEVDDWDNWDTPLAPRNAQPNESQSYGDTSAGSNEAIPWPELKKITPSKLTRTVSDMLKDWDISSPKPEPDSGQSEHVQWTAHNGVKDE